MTRQRRAKRPRRTERVGPLFVEEAQARGLRFSHRNGMTGALYMPETVGAGGALLDYDGDGDLDVYLVQGGAFRPGDVGGGGGAPVPQSAAGGRRAALRRGERQRHRGARLRHGRGHR